MKTAKTVFHGNFLVYFALVLILSGSCVKTHHHSPAIINAENETGLDINQYPDALSDATSNENNISPPATNKKDINSISNLYVVNPQNELGLSDSGIPVEAIIGGVAAVIVLGGSAAYFFKKNMSPSGQIEGPKTIKNLEPESPRNVATNAVKAKIESKMSMAVDPEPTKFTFLKSDLGMKSDLDLDHSVGVVENDKITVEIILFPQRINAFPATVAIKQDIDGFMDFFEKKSFEVTLLKNHEGYHVYNIAPKKALTRSSSFDKIDFGHDALNVTYKDSQKVKVRQIEVERGGKFRLGYIMKRNAGRYEIYKKNYGRSDVQEELVEEIFNFSAAKNRFLELSAQNWGYGGVQDFSFIKPDLLNMLDNFIQ